MYDGKALGIEIVEAVKAHFDRKLSPILERMCAFDGALLGFKADLAAVSEKQIAMGSAIASVETGLVDRLFDAKLAELPIVRIGEVEEVVGRAMDARLGEAVKTEVAKIELPEPRKGKDGADGIGLADGSINHDGHLVLSTTAGEFRVLSRVVGRDGTDGRPGERGDRGEKGEPGEPGTSVVLEDIKGIVIGECKVGIERLYREYTEFRDAVEADIKNISAKEIETEITARMAAASNILGDNAKALIEEELAKRPPEKGDPGLPGPPGPAGRDAEPVPLDLLQVKICSEVREVVAALPPAEKGAPGAPGPAGKDGEPVSIELLQEKICSEIREAVAALPAAEKGDPGPPGPAGRDAEPVPVALIQEKICSEVREAVAALPAAEKGDPGPPGEKGDPGMDAEPIPVDDIRAELMGTLRSAVESLPKPQDGHTPTEEELAVLVQKAVLALPRRVRALIDRHGIQHEVMSDGSTVEIGQVVGRDGRDGRDGVDGPPGVPGKDGFGKDGADGKDGRDGFGFDDMVPEWDEDQQELTLRWQRGEDVRKISVRMPFPRYIGVFREDHAYKQGNSVSFGGSLWVAVKDPTGKPAEHSDSGWKLAVRAGRSGKDGEKGEKGDPGRPGRDLTR